MKYKFLEDIAIADIAYEAYGKNLNELFANAALAVSDTMVDLNTVEHHETKIIEIKEKQIDLLLFDFLAEIIFVKDTESLLLNKFDVKIEKNKINKLKIRVHDKHGIQSSYFIVKKTKSSGYAFSRKEIRCDSDWYEKRRHNMEDFLRCR